MRSKLFVPASRPELFEKALRSNADAISFDLEDAVHEDRKAQAREHLSRHLQQQASHKKIMVVRTNAMDTEHFAADLQACVWHGLDMVNLPKVEDAQTIKRAAALLEKLEAQRGIGRPIGILANIESPRGLRLAADIATAHPRVAGLQIGYGDLFSPLGIISGERSAQQFVRIQVRMAAGEAGIDAYDGAYVDIANPQGYTADAQEAHELGFAGKSCIHPTQIDLANQVFRPSQTDIDHALRVVEATKNATTTSTGAFVVDGRLVDGPFIARAEKLVALARRLGLAG